MKANLLALATITIRVSSMFLGLLITITLVRISGPESVGYFTLLVLFVSFSATPVKGAVASILFRQLARARSDEQRRRAAAMLKFSYISLLYTLPVAVVFTSLLLLRLNPSQAEPIRMVILIVIAIMTLESWAAIQLSALRGVNRSLFAQMLDGVIRPMSILLGIATVLTVSDQNMPITNIALGYFAGLVLTRLIGSIVLLRAKESLRVPAMKMNEFFSAHGSQAALFLGSSFSATAIASFDIALAGVLLSVEQLGYYKLILQLCVVANALFVGLNFHVAREFATYQTEDPQKLEERARYLAQLSCIFATTVVVGLCFVGSEAALWLFNETLPTEWYLFGIVGTSFVVNSAFGMGSAFLMMNHDEHFVFIWSLSTILICLPIGYILVLALGIYGPGTALFAITLIWNTGLAWRCIRKFHFNPTIFNLRRLHA